MTTFSRNGTELWFSEAGDGAPVVLHTGGAGDSEMFRNAGYVDALERAGFRVVCFDHRGHGRSGKPLRVADHRVSEYVADVVGLLDVIGVPSAAIVGYSQGMQVAIALAAAQPDRVSAVVGIGAVGGADDPTDWLAEAAGAVRAHGLRSSMEAFAARESDPPPGWLIDNLSETDPEVFALSLEAQLDDEWRLWESFSQVRAPTLLVVGEYEEHEDGGEADLAGRNARRAAETMPDGRAFVVRGVSHLGVFWRTDLTLPTIETFLAASA